MHKDEQDATPEEGPLIVCIGCAQPIPEASDFCPHCGAPVGSTACLDPWKQILSQGYANRRFTFGMPRKWALVTKVASGLLIVPLMIAGFCQADHAADRIWALLLLALYAAFYVRALLNYRRLYGRKKGPPNQDPREAAVRPTHAP